MSQELLFALFSDWYGIDIPSFRRFQNFSSTQFNLIWTNKWFAKQEQQRFMDAYLLKYKPLFDTDPETMKSQTHSAYHLMIDITYMILWDQVSRNIFRNSAGAYATDAKARALVETLMPKWSSLPLPIQISCILVYIHSEDKEDLKIVADLLEKVNKPMQNYPDVFRSLQGIANNHKDRMQLFGRIPERNRFLNRLSTDKEMIYLSVVASL